MPQTVCKDGSPDRKRLLPEWVESAEKPPWPEETVFVQEGSTFFNQTSITRVEVDGTVYEGYPLGDNPDAAGYWPEALWQYDGEIVTIPFEGAEFLGSDVRSWGVLGSSGLSREWESVEWERIPDEIEPTEQDRSPWNETRDVFGRDMWVHEDENAVSYSDSLPAPDATNTTVTPPWPENITFNTYDDDITATSIGSVNQLVQARGEEGTEQGFVLDTTPLRLWTQNGEVVTLTDATVTGEALATYFDRLDHFPEYDPDTHREPVRNLGVEGDAEYINPQLNDNVGSDEQSGVYIDSLGVVHTPQEGGDHGEWGLHCRTLGDATSEKVMNIYRGSVDRDVFDQVDDAIASWVNDPRHANEFHATGEAVTGNTKHTPSKMSSDTVAALQSYSDFTTAYLKATERGTITLYRYLDSEVADALIDSETTVAPRAAASWATSMGGAASTAQTVWHTDSDGVILEAEIPAENILATSDAHGIFNNNEDEMIVALPEEIDLSNMKIHGHGEYNPNNE